MIKTLLFAGALLSLALATGCAKGGNGGGTQPITVTVSPQPSVYPGQTTTFTATVAPASTSQVVSWSLSGTACTGGGNPCGTINATTGAYVAPATVPTPPQVTITATSQADPSATGTDTVDVVDITTDVSPSSLSVGSGLTQQFTAVAVPDDAPQTFTWTCTASNVTCANFHVDPNVSGLAYYTGNDSCSGSCIQISAASTLDPNGCTANPKFCTTAKASLVSSRVNGTYAFRFSGYDGSGNATSVVGTFTATNGVITSGFEDELTSTGPAQHTITGGSYTPTASDPNNSNNAGTLTLTTGAFPNTFQVVLDGAGDIEMIEADSHGMGSGIAQISSNANLLKGDQTYAFGFTGVDATGKRVGYVGVLPLNGSGSIVAGQMDTNDNGATSNVCGASPCSITGAYTGPNANGAWHMILNTSGSTLGFDFFIAGGSASKGNPLTFFAISTDLTAIPAVSGTMVLQDSTQTYNAAAFKGTSVSALTGVGVNGANTNLSLTLGTTDGNGNFTGQFDQNNAGTILTVPTSPSAALFAYTYAASGTNGRYTFNMLGNPDASPAVPALPFVLYASGANRGFLLDQSSSSVMTGTMNPQGSGGGTFAASELPGTYAAATTSSGDPAATPLAANLLLTSPGSAVYNVFGTPYPPGPTQPLNGSYTLSDLGTGTIALTTPSVKNYVIYTVDTSGCTKQSGPVCTIQDFFMMDETTTPNPEQNAAIIFAKQ
ncbi:MAG TPA: hypothetical protein VK828_05100 [Terriglobales bacterium]|jgi:hypothetical protein|nr:hypothetical protein [Terriglobales bacterium]